MWSNTLLFSDCIFDFALKYEIGYDGAISYQAENTRIQMQKLRLN